ncbi:MAG: nucleotidyltransferase [Pedobacter sp.]|jgi:protein ImuB|nr:nucleotidyltransferase [Pedobacter sp.]
MLQIKNYSEKPYNMQKRFLCIWFRHLTTDWLSIRKPELKGMPYVFAVPVHGRMMIVAASAAAELQGATSGMAVADAKALIPSLQVFDDKPTRPNKLLKGLGEYCIRYTPIVAIDNQDGLILDISGCSHLWGAEEAYLKEIVSRLQSKGYDVRAAIADTIGAAWGISRFGKDKPVVEAGRHTEALMPLPAAALRLDPLVLQRLNKLGLYQISSFIRMPKSNLRRRFGEELLLRIRQATGQEEEPIKPIVLQAAYQERLPCMEPIRTANAIGIAIQRLLGALCKRLQTEGMGIRTATLLAYRIDGKIEQVTIGTNRATFNTSHLLKLFELKIAQIRPGLGIELFILEAAKIEEVDPVQEKLWAAKPAMEDTAVAELLDRLEGKVGSGTIHRYLPEEHYWPERSIKVASSIAEITNLAWPTDRPRPTKLLSFPEPIQVTAPIPDYPPMLFRYKGKVHPIKKADGPERIEREWWMDAGEHRDYYTVEDEAGQRYWLFRSGHYTEDHAHQWFIHGFFA